jgi:hypothetical protein
VDLSTTVETYFLARDGSKGLNHRLSWLEVNARFNDATSTTVSFLEMPNRRMLDEVYGRFDFTGGSVRAGRMATAFGLSDWSERFYNGFNHIPLVRLFPLADGLRLTRDDSGVETTVYGAGYQIQLALVDNDLNSFQVLPERFRTATVRIQADQWSTIFGLNALRDFDKDRNVYGIDFRWTHPRFLVKAEAFKGSDAEKLASGYYIDAAYRVPKMPRTQLCARTESYKMTGAYFHQETRGIRQVFRDIVSVNLNYGWSHGTDGGFLSNAVPNGWSLQTMLRLNF